VETVVVTAPALPPSPADAVFSVVRLDPQVLATAPRLDEALAQVPGFSLYRRVSSLGANPTTQGASLRGIAGSAASRALVTLDGVPVNDPFGGWVIFTAIPGETVGAVDVVRGAGAGPYGAGALTGVVSLRSIAMAPGQWTADAKVGSLGWGRVAAVGAFDAGGNDGLVWGDYEHSDGWTPVIQGRGAADERLTLQDEAVGGRLERSFGAATGELRASLYQEDRGAGTLDAGSRARGFQLAATAAQAPQGERIGWRAQAWVIGSDLANSAATVAADRNSATPANNEFQTPALGLGLNGQVRRDVGPDTFELGVDLREMQGEDREDFSAVSGVLTKLRHAGGGMFIGGVYGEATQQTGRWLLAEGARLDGWQTFDGHDREQTIATGVQTLDLKDAGRGGVTPTGRLGVRYDLGGGLWLRTAGYAGFRAPTLNELYRTFRVGQNVTLANAALTPERLYGGEAGLGGTWSGLRLDADVFYNDLENPVTNVTLAAGPISNPVGGFVPAGGSLLQRENVGAIHAWGVEADGSYRLAPTLTARAAISWARATVEGGTTAPRLTGLQPAETPATTVTAGLDWRPLHTLSFTSDLRWESRRFADDQNQLPLAAAIVVNARLDWQVRPGLGVFVAADNIFDVRVEQNEATNGLYSFGPPRLLSVGVVLGAGRSMNATPRRDVEG
jgi:outer membrane receptor protein involved in Fe transport